MPQAAAAHFGPLQFAVLAALIFFAGFVDALAGGGGLISLPAYLSLGLSPGLVLGTNKLSSFIGTIASTANYQRRLRVGLKEFAPVIAASLAGACFGARLTALLDPRRLKYLMLAVMPILAYVLYTHHRFGRADRSHEFPAGELKRRSVLIAFPIGCYDGFFGPGTGTFFALAFSRFCGYDLLGSTARAKILNLASNAAALAAFLYAGRVHLALGLAMGAAGAAGHYAGSHLGLKKGAGAIRPVILLVCAGLFAKLLYDVSRP